jgi:hypothetical protein
MVFTMGMAKVGKVPVVVNIEFLKDILLYLELFKGGVIALIPTVVVGGSTGTLIISTFLQPLFF